MRYAVSAELYPPPPRHVNTQGELFRWRQANAHLRRIMSYCHLDVHAPQPSKILAIPLIGQPINAKTLAGNTLSITISPNSMNGP